MNTEIHIFLLTIYCKLRKFYSMCLGKWTLCTITIFSQLMLCVICCMVRAWDLCQISKLQSQSSIEFHGPKTLSYSTMQWQLQSLFCFDFTLAFCFFSCSGKQDQNSRLHLQCLNQTKAAGDGPGWRDGWQFVHGRTDFLTVVSVMEWWFKKVAPGRVQMTLEPSWSLPARNRVRQIFVIRKQGLLRLMMLALHLINH